MGDCGELTGGVTVAAADEAADATAAAATADTVAGSRSNPAKEGK